MNPAYLRIGDDLLSNALLDTVSVTQELNRHWVLEVEFRQTSDERPHYESYLGKPCSLFAYDQDGAQGTVFEGFVLKSELRYLAYGNYGGHLVAVSQSYKTDLAPRYFCYTTSALSAIASQAAGFTGISAKVQAGAQLAPKQYVQWGETDYRFLLRLADDHGAWIRATTSGIEILDQFQAGTTATFQQEMGLLSFEAGGGMAAPSMNGAHYDPLVMQSQSYTAIAQPPAFTGASGPLANAVEQSSQALPPGYVFERSRVPTLGDYQQRLRLESERALGAQVIGHGISRVLRLKAGDKVEIDGALDASGSYGLTKVIHRWTLHGYENEFWCTPWTKWMEPQAPLCPIADGVFPARIVEHSDPLGVGRYRIRFWWQEQGEPMLWARMMTPHAGQSRGFFFQPEVGDEVVVVFEDGDPERPVILGSVWNGVDTAPTEDFWGGEYEPNDVKRIVTKSGNRVQMVDKPGKEAISFATPENLKLSMFEKATETGRSMIQLSNANGDILISAPNGRIHLHGKYVSREAGDAAAGPASTAAAPLAHLQPVSPPVAPSTPVVPVAPKAAQPVPQKKGPCAIARDKDNELAQQAVARAQAMWQKSGMPGELPQNGPTWFPADQSHCLNKAAEMQGRAARFQKYNQALPYARAAQDVNELGDKPGSAAKGKPCITRLPDTGAELSKALGLPPKTIKNDDLQQDNNGFRAAMYRDDATGKLILVPRDTEPHSLSDWKTNTDNATGLDSNQYKAMRELTQKLIKHDVAFDFAGYSKGGGLVQEGALMAPNSESDLARLSKPGDLSRLRGTTGGASSNVEYHCSRRHSSQRSHCESDHASRPRLPANKARLFAQPGPDDCKSQGGRSRRPPVSAVPARPRKRCGNYSWHERSRRTAGRQSART
ncbi:MAG TPA: phage baseplate assembly protein V [Bryobacteraceae bacterium]|nr:phage baseplate assembly protein V [Bryobacteraceae bacterium]